MLGTGNMFPTPTSIYTMQEGFLHFCRKYYQYPKCTGICMKVRHLVGLDFSTLYLLHKCRKISGTYCKNLASFPGLPRFSSLVCVQHNTLKRYGTRTEELKRGRPGNEASKNLELLENISSTSTSIYGCI